MNITHFDSLQFIIGAAAEQAVMVRNPLSI